MARLLSRIAMAVLLSFTALAETNDYLDVIVARVRPEKRTEFDALVNKMADANRRFEGDSWIGLQVEYGEQDTVFLMRARPSYAAIEKGSELFTGALNKAYGVAGQRKIFQEFKNCVLNSQSEIRRQRWDLSFNVPVGRDMLTEFGAARWLRTAEVHVRPGHNLDYETQLKAIKVAAEEGNAPKQRVYIGQSIAGATGSVYYISWLYTSLGDMDSPVRSLQQMLGDSGYRSYLKVLGDSVLGTDTVIYRALPELSNPSKEVAVGSPEFWKPKPPNYATVKVFYATDRNATGRAEPADYYGSARTTTDALSLGVCEVSIPRDHRMGALEEASIWKLEFRADPEKHVVLRSVIQEGYNDFYRDLSGRVKASKRKEAFVFIHGFNMSFEDSARRTAQLSYDLGFDGAAILYSWPSEARFLRYTVDESNVEWTGAHLKGFLEDIAKRSGAEKVHLIAHSMGNRALTNVLHSLASEGWAGSRHFFNQVVLTAPDIDAQVFSQLAGRLRQTAERVTLYASSNDKALRLSKEIHGYPRAGDSGDNVVVVPGIDTIDVSAVDTDFTGHSYYAEKRSLLTDLFLLIREGKSPSERFGLNSVPIGGGQTYYIFKP